MSPPSFLNRAKLERTNLEHNDPEYLLSHQHDTKRGDHDAPIRRNIYPNSNELLREWLAASKHPAFRLLSGRSVIQTRQGTSGFWTQIGLSERRLRMTDKCGFLELVFISV